MINMEDVFQPTGPSPVQLETVEVELDPTLMVGDFASAFVKEASRKAPLIFKEQPLDVQEVTQYFFAILQLRVDNVNNEQVDWRRMKLLAIPDFLQMSISMIGEVTIRQSGIRLQPSLELYDFDKPTHGTDTPRVLITWSSLLEISEKIRVYEDVLCMKTDAFPRSSEGNVDVMSTALINGYVRSLKPATHPVDTYVAAFLGFKLKEENTFQILYRINYDDVEYVQMSINQMARRLL